MLYISWRRYGSNLYKKKFQHLVHISLNQFESKHPNFFTFPTLVNHETPLISKEEPINPFVAFPPPFSVSMWVPPYDDYKVWKSKNQIPHESSLSSSAFHDWDSMEEIPKWLMKSMVNTNSSILKDDAIVRNSSLKSDLDFCYLLSYKFHDSLYHDLLE